MYWELCMHVHKYFCRVGYKYANAHVYIRMGEGVGETLQLNMYV